LHLFIAFPKIDLHKKLCYTIQKYLKENSNINNHKKSNKRININHKNKNSNITAPTPTTQVPPPYQPLIETATLHFSPPIKHKITSTVFQTLRPFSEKKYIIFRKHGNGRVVTIVFVSFQGQQRHDQGQLHANLRTVSREP